MHRRAAPGAVRCRAARADALAAGHRGARSAQRLDFLQDGIRRRRACRSGDATRMGWQLRSGHHQRGMVAPGRLDVHPHRAAAADREHGGARAGGTGARAPGRPRDFRTRVPGRGDHRQRTGSLRAAAGDRHGASGSHHRDLRTDGWGDPVEPPATVRRDDSTKGHDSFRTGCGDLPALHAGRRRLRQQGADCRLRDRSDRRPCIDEGNRRTHAVAAARRFSRGDRAGSGRRPRDSVTRPLRRTTRNRAHRRARGTCRRHLRERGQTVPSRCDQSRSARPDHRPQHHARTARGAGPDEGVRGRQRADRAPSARGGRQRVPAPARRELATACRRVAQAQHGARCGRPTAPSGSHSKRSAESSPTRRPTSSTPPDQQKDQQSQQKASRTSSN